MKKTPGEKPSDQKMASVSSNSVEHKIEAGKPQQRYENKKVKEAPKPFNNPFADVLKRR